MLFDFDFCLDEGIQLVHKLKFVIWFGIFITVYNLQAENTLEAQQLIRASQTKTQNKYKCLVPSSDLPFFNALEICYILATRIFKFDLEIAEIIEVKVGTCKTKIIFFDSVIAKC